MEAEEHVASEGRGGKDEKVWREVGGEGRMTRRPARGRGQIREAGRRECKDSVQREES